MNAIFTGIIEELGKLEKLDKGSEWGRITVQAKVVLDDVKMGDSIAVNGVCLTVVDFTKDHFSADVMAETLDKTNLGGLKAGSVVNLERAVRFSDHMGGHIVQGHVDGVGAILEEHMVGIAKVVTFRAPKNILDFTVPKGSIAIDGISLTVVDVTAETFSVSLIPHTAAMTTLGHKKPGDTVNLEADIVGRYIYKFMHRDAEEEAAAGLTLSTLAENGFI